jgi:Ser/Thr protein kinase RdoA (MazF antagonist)
VRPEDAAVTIARRFGVVAAEPVVLSNSNNVVVWLRPSPVVAKVASGHLRRPAVELAVAQHLVSCGAPVVRPSGQLPQVVHRAGGLEVTFWEYQRPSGKEPDERELASSLFELHRALPGYRGPLPSYRDELSAMAAVLGDAARVPALAAGDRALLQAALVWCDSELARHPPAGRPLHGSPHSSNVIATRDGIRFIDLETACVGPLEWDLAHVGDQAVRAYPGRFDRGRLELCRALVSVKTAAWCWAGFEQPALRWHAEHHLAVVKRLMAGDRRLNR